MDRVKDINKIKNEAIQLYEKYYPDHIKLLDDFDEDEKKIYIIEFQILDNKLIFRWGQEEVYSTFSYIIHTEKKYWGILIAPTGFGKSFLHFLMCGLYLKNNNKTAIILTKRKEILKDLLKNNEINLLKDHNFMPQNVELIDQVNSFDLKNFNKKYDRPTIIICNVDKLIYIPKNKKKERYHNINWELFGLQIIDEVHWAGADGIYKFLTYTKNVIPFGIGSSATPVRETSDNQMHIKEIFGDKEELNILHEVGYDEAWEHKIILPVEHNYEIVQKEKHVKIIGTKYEYEFTSEGKKYLLDKIKKYKLVFNKIIFYFKNIKSLLEWFNFVIDNNIFPNYELFRSFSIDRDNRREYKLEEQVESIKNGIANFKKKDNNAILFVVMQATEGFDDKKVELVANLDVIQNQGLLVLLQKIGRAQRIYEGKEKAYFFCPIIEESEEEHINYLCKLLSNFIEHVITKNRWVAKGRKSRSTYLDFIKNNIKINNKNRKLSSSDISNRIKQIRTDNPISIARNKSRKYNRDQIKKNNNIKELIDNDKLLLKEEDILNYLYQDEIRINLIEEKDIIRFALGPYFYDKLTDIYFTKTNDYKNEFNKLNITSLDDYKKKYKQSNKLPPLYLLDAKCFTINLTIIFQEYDDY